MRAPSQVLHAGCERHDHLDAVAPERAVAELGDRGHRLGVGEADARRYAGAPRARAELHAEHVRQRVLLVEHMDGLDVVLRRHRAVDGHGQRHHVAVLDQRRQVELDPAFLQPRLAHHALERGAHGLGRGGRWLHGERKPEAQASGQCGRVSQETASRRLRSVVVGSHLAKLSRYRFWSDVGVVLSSRKVAR